MSNDQCAAIINAIGAAAEFLFTNGIPIRQPIGDPTNDATSKGAAVTAFEAVLTDLISNLPDES